MLEQWYENILKELLSQQLWTAIGIGTLKIMLYLIIGRLVVSLLRKIAIKLIPTESSLKPLQRFDQRRMRTMSVLVGHIINYTGNFIIILLILSQIGVDLAPLLAGAGVLGLAVGFGAQNFVKDVIAGFFIIFEDQFAVGDAVQIGTYKGTVEEIGLRITKIRSWNGELYIVPNGMITQVVNYSVFNSFAVVDLLIPHATPLELAIQRIQHYLTEKPLQHDALVNQPKILGVTQMNEHGVILRVTAECKPNSQHEIQRKLYEEIKKQLEISAIKEPSEDNVRDRTAD